MIKLFHDPHLKKGYFKLVFAFSGNLNLPYGLQQSCVEIRSSIAPTNDKLEQAERLQNSSQVSDLITNKLSKCVSKV